MIFPKKYYFLKNCCLLCAPYDIIVYITQNGYLICQPYSMFIFQ